MRFARPHAVVRPIGRGRPAAAAIALAVGLMVCVPAGASAAQGEVVRPAEGAKGEARAARRMEVMFSVGCLTRVAGDRWTLTRASRPEPVGAVASAMPDVPLGTATFRLLGMDVFKPASHAGNKVRIEGLVTANASDTRKGDTQSGDARISVTSLRAVARGCAS